MPKFAKEPDGSFYNEWYGAVPKVVKEAIVKGKWSPSDFDMKVYEYGSLESLANALAAK